MRSVVLIVARLLRLASYVVSHAWVVSRDNSSVLAFLPGILVMLCLLRVCTCHQPLVIQHRGILPSYALPKESGSQRDIGLFLAKIDAFTLLLHCLLSVSTLIENDVRVNTLVRPGHAHLGKLLGIVGTLSLGLS